VDVCAMGINFDTVSTIFDCVLELFRQCGICFLFFLLRRPRGTSRKHRRMVCWWITLLKSNKWNQSTPLLFPIFLFPKGTAGPCSDTPVDHLCCLHVCQVMQIAGKVNFM